MQLFCDACIKKKGENSLDTSRALDTRDNSYKFRHFLFLAFAKFTIKTTTELVQFYSLNTENKEHHMLRVKMLTKIIMAIFFSVYSVGGKSTYSD